jgi:general stress protein 26
MPLYSQEQIHMLAARIKDMRYGMLTTMDDARHLSSRPLRAQQLDDEGNLWFLASDEAGFTHDLQRHPQVNVCFASPDQQHYLSVSGQAYLLKDRARARQLWSSAACAWLNGLDDPHLTLIRLKIHTAECWDARTSRMRTLAQLAGSAITRRVRFPPGRHTTICL